MSLFASFLCFSFFSPVSAENLFSREPNYPNNPTNLMTLWVSPEPPPTKPDLNSLYAPALTRARPHPPTPTTFWFPTPHFPPPPKTYTWVPVFDYSCVFWFRHVPPPNLSTPRGCVVPLLLFPGVPPPSACFGSFCLRSAPTSRPPFSPPQNYNPIFAPPLQSRLCGFFWALRSPTVLVGETAILFLRDCVFFVCPLLFL